MPTSLDKTELVDGEVVVSPAPSFRHQEILRRLVVALSLWAEGRSPRPTIGLAPLDIRFAPNRILQPDLFVLFAAIPSHHKGPLDRIPELCIEILSSDRVYDRVTKRILYAAAGIAELWIAEQEGPLERWTGASLKHSEELDRTVQTDLLPGFSLDLQRLFAG